jgi:hypothetical protein
MLKLINIRRLKCLCKDKYMEWRVIYDVSLNEHVYEILYLGLDLLT